MPEILLEVPGSHWRCCMCADVIALLGADWRNHSTLWFVCCVFKPCSFWSHPVGLSVLPMKYLLYQVSVLVGLGQFPQPASFRQPGVLFCFGSLFLMLICLCFDCTWAVCFLNKTIFIDQEYLKVLGCICFDAHFGLLVGLFVITVGLLFGKELKEFFCWVRSLLWYFSLFLHATIPTNHHEYFSLLRFQTVPHRCFLLRVRVSFAFDVLCFGSLRYT